MVAFSREYPAFPDVSVAPERSDTVTDMAETMIPLFRGSDGQETAKWYARQGFTVVGEHRVALDLPLYMFLDRNGV